MIISLVLIYKVAYSGTALDLLSIIITDKLLLTLLKGSGQLIFKCNQLSFNLDALHGLINIIIISYYKLIIIITNAN